MAYDFKRAQKELYLPPDAPQILYVPPMQYAAISGQGDPNMPGGAYQQAISQLYAVAYTLRMSYKGSRQIEGFFEYVVPPLESFWWTNGEHPTDKQAFRWTALLRLPDFIRPDDLIWAKEEVLQKKKLNGSAVELLRAEEGLCVQIMHHGSYDSESVSVALMNAYIYENGYTADFSDQRPHHEIYLSDPRKTATAKIRTVIRHPIRPL